MSLARRFMERFAGLGRAHGTYVITPGGKRDGKVTGRARTLKEPVTEDIWRAHLDGRVGLGIVPIDDGGRSRFGAIDVDVYDLNLERLERLVNESGLPLVTCRTKSGGAHLYLFTSEPLPAGLVRDKLMEWAVAIGYPSVEVFPKQAELAGEDDVGNWINMPYFDCARTLRYAVSDGKPLTAEEFLELADRAAVNEGAVRGMKVKRDEELADGPPCLEFLARAGFPEGTRNKALFNLGVFARVAHGDEWKVKMDEYNRRYMRPPLSSAEVRAVTKSLDRKDYTYTCRETPVASACNRSICVRRKHGVTGFQGDPGVQMDGLVKILTSPPTWLLNVNGRRLRLESTDDLIVQARFTRACVEAFSIMPQTVARVAWENHVRLLLEKAEEIDAPEDAGAAGQFLFLLEQFCTEQTSARNREELFLGKPYTEDGWTYFRSFDLLSYVEKRRLRLTAKEAWVILREAGARTKQFKVKGKCIRCWAVREFSTLDGGLEPPTTERGEF